MKTITQFILIILSSANLLAQNKLIFHTESVDSLLVWMQDGCNKNNIDNLVLQPATQLMEQLLRHNEKGDIPTFKETLQEFNRKDTLSGNIYMLNTAYRKQAEMENLINKIRNTDFSENVYNRVLKYFPESYVPSRNYEVFFTPVGWQWGDAMMFSYIVKDGKYLISGEGTPAFMFNLTIVSMLYGDNTTQQMSALEDVMSHELFHAVFFDYTNSNWSFGNNENINNTALTLMLNEGVAHYIADGELLRSDYDKDDNLKQKELQAFALLSDGVKIIFNTEYSDEIRRNAIHSGTFGDYWTKYMCIPGMFMSYQIEQHYGIEGIQECVKNGAIYFMKKYESLRKIKTQLPKLPKEIIKFIE